jgi:hypothetical protein
MLALLGYRMARFLKIIKRLSFHYTPPRRFPLPKTPRIVDNRISEFRENR